MEEECCCKVGCWRCQVTLQATPEKNPIPELAQELWNAFFVYAETRSDPCELQYDDMRIGENSVRFKFKDAWFEVKQTH